MVSYFTVKVLEKEMLRSIKERSLAAEKSILGTLNSVMTGHDENIMEEMREVLKTLPHKNVTVSIADTTGKIFFSSDSTRIGKYIFYRANTPLHLKDNYPIRYLNRFKKMIVLRPIVKELRCQRCHTSSERYRGLLEISVSTEHLSAQLLKIRNLIVFDSVVVLFIISIMLGLLFHILVSKPLHTLAQSMKRVEKGDLSTRALTKRNDEIGLLSNCFNAMVARLQNMLKEIELKYQKELQHADRLSTLGELAAGIAHEIRNPLAAISGAIHVQTMEMAGDDPNRKVMEEIQDEIKRLDNSLKSFLAYSRPAKPQLMWVDLHDLLEKAFTLCQRSGQFAGIRLQKEFNNKIPPLQLDPFLMQQVFVNIIINALQAMNHQGVLTVKTEVESAVAVRIIFEDTGPGIAPDVLKRIFQPFFSTKSQGTGLGLAIANRIIEQHHGKIFVESTLGKGTKFTIELAVKFFKGSTNDAESENFNH